MKIVLLRVDFNVPIQRWKIVDDFKIRAHIPTIHDLLRRGAQVFLITHLEQNGIVPHLDFVRRHLEHILRMKVGFLRGQIIAQLMPFSEQVVLFDNIRLNSDEKKNDVGFARRLAHWGDVYINDAFAESHRPYTSIIGVPKFLPSFLGPLVKKEVLMLSKLFMPRHPFLVVIAGNKFATKEPLISKFLEKADHIFIGGALANTFLKARGNNIGKSIAEKITIHKKLLWNKKIILPTDFTVKNGVIYDSGPATAKILEDLVKKSKFILWNGTLGLCEKGFDFGTKSFAEALGKSKAYKIAGGGDTVTAIHKFGLQKNFDFLSTGGGAMLEFLTTGTLPGIDAIKKKKTAA